jgi:uncharacterized membrane protein
MKKGEGMEQPRGEGEIGLWIHDAWVFYQQHWTRLLIPGLLVLVINTVSLGLLSGPMLAGLAAMVLAFWDRRSPASTAGYVFTGFARFLQTLVFAILIMIALVLASLILNMVPILGGLAGLVISLAGQGFMILGLCLIMDENVGFGSAFTGAAALIKMRPLPVLGLLTLAGMVATVGFVILWIGAIFTMPLAVAMVVSCYRNLTGAAGAGSDHIDPLGSRGEPLT